MAASCAAAVVASPELSTTKSAVRYSENSRLRASRSSMPAEVFASARTKPRGENVCRRRHEHRRDARKMSLRSGDRVARDIAGNNVTGGERRQNIVVDRVAKTMRAPGERETPRANPFEIGGLSQNEMVFMRRSGTGDAAGHGKIKPGCAASLILTSRSNVSLPAPLGPTRQTNMPAPCDKRKMPHETRKIFASKRPDTPALSQVRRHRQSRPLRLYSLFSSTFYRAIHPRRGHAAFSFR